MLIRAAVLTVSDSTFAGTRVDKSGPAVEARLRERGFEIASLTVVPDERTAICDRLKKLADGGEVNVIFTTGGTGVALRDVTPEATRDAIDREIPGFGERMRTFGLQFTPKSILSRALAGTRKQVLIINLPGSPAGAVQSLDAIVELVPHAVQLLDGDTAHAEPDVHSKSRET
jgi:molybdenum cofactor synthesis domain-containing protein